MKVAVFDYGAGNVHSACHAIERAGATAILTHDAGIVEDAEAVLVPGVGAFGYVMDRFKSRGGPELVHMCLAENKPVLGICVGMQIFFEKSIEKGAHSGLGILSGIVEELPAHKLPHMGWSHVQSAPESRMFTGIGDERFYFVHSFGRLSQPPVSNLACEDTVVVTEAQYGQAFIAAIESGPLWVTQFHPEKSGHAGLKLLKNWLAAAGKENE